MRRFLLFCLAGAVAAVAHYALMAALILFHGAPPVFASSAGVVLATLVAFLGNHFVTFADADGTWQENGPRWMLVAGAVWLINGVVLKFLLLFELPVIPAQLAASLVSFLFSFSINRRFTFRL
ncbi:MAG: GtrA family protein [Pseudomonadales bacterium]|nr:GtrA family protein [Pseudomonadales bacterium]